MLPKVLLTSVFKPFAVDDLYSRKESIIELLHNQLTKVQGIYSLRTFYDSYGIHAIGKNLGIPCTVLDFPTQKRFIREIQKGYDYIGISAIVHNFQKVKWMVQQIRTLSPRSKIILGGFCASIPNLQKILDVDYVCIGDGISFLREMFGLPENFEFRNPDVKTDLRELMGVPLFGIPQIPQIVIGLGCSYGCDFCSPSHFFGKKHIKFYKTGQALFNAIRQASHRFSLDIISLIGDDNFLIDLQRAEELRRCMVESGQLYNLMIFGSADKVMEFGVERLAEMGVSIIWIGREGRFSNYPKNRHIDMKALVDDLRRYGIKTILSSILLLDHHTQENIREEIDEHLACRPAFSQFSHYAPVPGTALWARMNEQNRLIPGIPWEEMHAFNEPWFYHSHFTVKEGKDIQEEAYQRDFHELGPSVFRLIETEYRGWEYLRHATNPHLKARAGYFARQMRTYKILLTAMENLVPTDPMRQMINALRKEIEKSFGKVQSLHRAAASAIYLAGRFREFRNKHWGDVLQPPTRYVRYNGL